jgi:hypothetical protein
VNCGAIVGRLNPGSYRGVEILTYLPVPLISLFGGVIEIEGIGVHLKQYSTLVLRQSLKACIVVFVGNMGENLVV